MRARAQMSSAHEMSVESSNKSIEIELSNGQKIHLREEKIGDGLILDVIVDGGVYIRPLASNHFELRFAR